MFILNARIKFRANIFDLPVLSTMKMSYFRRDPLADSVRIIGGALKMSQRKERHNLALPFFL